MPTRSQSGRKTVMACLLKNEPTSLCIRRKLSPLPDEAVGKPSVNSAFFGDKKLGTKFIWYLAFSSLKGRMHKTRS